MIRFDKLKIITDINYISNINDKAFTAQSVGEQLLYYKYNIKKPYSLCIIADYQHSELSIEFTGKILKDEYIHLINKTNIRKCFEEINGLGICTLSIDEILQNSKVCKCDITKDICCKDLNNIIAYIKQNLCNYRKWIPKEKRNGIVLENAADTPRYRKRLTIYNKEHELGLSGNKDFLGLLSDRKALLDYFKGKIRFELNVNAEAQIRTLLEITNNTLNEVLTSTANPLKTVFNEAVKETGTTPCAKNVSNYLRYLLLKDCDFNLAIVEAKIRALSSKNTAISRAMQPYRQLLNDLNRSAYPDVKIQELISMV